MFSWHSRNESGEIFWFLPFWADNASTVEQKLSEKNQNVEDEIQTSKKQANHFSSWMVLSHVH